MKGKNLYGGEKRLNSATTKLSLYKTIIDCMSVRRCFFFWQVKETGNETCALGEKALCRMLSCVYNVDPVCE
jgi:hypothetical protein